MGICDFVEQSSQMDSREAVLAFMECAAADLGFDRYAYCALTCHERYHTGDNPAPVVAHNFPASWVDHYFEHNYQSKDPVVLHAPELEGPFLWDWLSIAFKLDAAQQTILQQARESGLRDGVGVPLHGPHGDVCLVTFAAGDGHPDPAAELQKLHMLAVQFDVAYKKVGRSENNRHPVVALSVREHQCLQWTALGKYIGKLLGISEDTVKFHINKKVFKKLGVNNRAAAVYKAVQYGLLSLDSRSLVAGEFRSLASLKSGVRLTGHR